MRLILFTFAAIKTRPPRLEKWAVNLKNRQKSV